MIAIPLPIVVGVLIALLVLLFILRAIEVQNEEYIQRLEDDVNSSSEHHSRAIVELRDMNAELRRERDNLGCERDAYKRSVHSAHEELDKCDCISDRAKSHQGLSIRIRSALKKSK